MFNALARTLAILSTLVITPLAISQLGVVEYGIWVLAAMIPSLVASADLGITHGVVNHMSQVVRRDGTLQSEHENLQSIARLLNGVAVGWLLLGVMGIYFYVYGMTGIPQTDQAAMFLALVVSLVIFCLSIPPSLWTKVQLSQQQAHQYALWEALGKLVSLIASVLVLVFYPNLLLLVLTSLLPSALALHANGRYYVAKTFGAVQATGRKSVRDTLQDNYEVFASGKYFFAVQVAFLVGGVVDPFLINSFLGTEKVSYLSVLRRPFDALPLVITVFSTALWPVFNNMRAAPISGRLLRFVGLLMSGSLILLGVLAAIIFLFSEPIYSYLSGGVLQIQVADMIWFCIFIIASTMAIVAQNYLNAAGKIKIQAGIHVLAAVISMILKIHVLAYGSLQMYFIILALSYMILVTFPLLILMLIDVLQNEKRSGFYNDNY